MRGSVVRQLADYGVRKVQTALEAGCPLQNGDMCHNGAWTDRATETIRFSPV